MFLELVELSALVALIGGLLSLDRTGAFQVMISRPLVSAALIGAVLGHSMLGLGVGVLVELLYMADLPVGGYMPTQETALAVLATTLSAAFLTGLNASAGAVPITGFVGTFSVIAPVLLLSILVAPIYRMADSFSRRMNEKLFCDVLAALEDGTGDSKTVQATNLKGLFNFFWPTAAMLFVSVFILSFLAFMIGSKFSGLEVAKFYPALAGFLILAIALALNAIKNKGSLIVFSVSGLLTALIWIAVK